MATLAEWQAQQNQNFSKSSQIKEDFNFGSDESGWAASMAAAIPSGIFTINGLSPFFNKIFRMV